MISDRLRTGDKAVITLIGGVAAYEILVRDDADLITYRVEEYRRNPVARVLIDGWLIATLLHLTGWVVPERDIYHWAVRYVRRRR